MKCALCACARGDIEYIDRRAYQSVGAYEYAPGACNRLESHLRSEIVGQDLAIQQASDAICDHLAQSDPQKPLVLSAHGPPGVGKTLMHLLLARALYSNTPEKATDCPGPSCPSYKVSQW